VEQFSCVIFMKPALLQTLEERLKSARVLIPLPAKSFDIPAVRFTLTRGGRSIRVPCGLAFPAKI
jgi:hypothetical protein